jgi:uncharacterized protein (TIGR03067 family)
MKPFPIPAAFAASLLTAILIAQAADSPQAADEKKKLEGTWVGGVKNPGGKGKSGGATMVSISELVIKDGVVVSCKDGKGVSLGKNDGGLTVNPASRTLDAKGSTRGHNGVFQGIYRINGDTLEWCASNPGKPRPADFFTTPQVQFHMVLTKKK